LDQSALAVEPGLDQVQAAVNVVEAALELSLE
jgi:hypothetical protein